MGQDHKAGKVAQPSSGAMDGQRREVSPPSSVVPLTHGAVAPEIAGSKAATLSRLAAAGFNVPEGIILTAAAFREFVQQYGLGPETDGTQVANLPLPDGTARALEDGLRAISDVPLAVRSSGIAEDLADASYAGQYETFLDVEGVAAVTDAVRRCWTSAFAARVREYRADVGERGLPPMAVLVQRLVEAEAAGVAFTANPVTGDRDVVVVSAVTGLGDRLMSGEATPDEWLVRNGQAEARSQPENAITREQALEIATLARRIEEHFGAPQDIEWALSGGQLYVLQARPITGLPQPPVLEIPREGTWLKDTGHYPELVTPFGASVYLPALDAGISNMCAEYGLMLAGMEQRSMGGEVYGRPVPVGGKEGPAPPWWLLAVLARIVPPIRARLKAARHAVRGGLLERLPEQWETAWRNEFQEESERLRHVNMSALDDAALLRHLDDAIDFLHRGQVTHFRLFIPYAVHLSELAVACRELLGWETLETLKLVAGLSTASSAPARALANLAAQVRQRPAALKSIESPEPDLHQRLAVADPEIGAAFGLFVHEYGHRALGYDPGAPTLAERPELLASLLRDTVMKDPADLEQQHAQRRAQAEARARDALAGRSEADRQRFETALAAARRTYPLREDNIFWTDNVPCGVIRGILLEAGRQLAQRGLLRRAGDVAYLEVDELRAALHDASPDVAATVARRRAEQAWVGAHPGPAFYGKPPSPPPDIRGLPLEARRTNGAIMWFMNAEFTPREPAGGTDLSGIPGSPGRYTGSVRVIRGEAEFDRLRPGEVLVCPVTTPTWSVLFANAGALVTDGGGVLSHAAVIAREHGIPAVLATGKATSALRDGQTVTVDGTAGKVTVHP